MKQKFRILLAMTTAMSSYAAPALAEDAAAPPAQAASADNSPSVGDIIVTARRRQESISKIPVAVTAFTGDTLVEKQITSTLDLTKLTPGLNFGGGGALSSSVVTIRGFSRALAGPGSPGVIVYFDDVPQSNFAANIPTYDMATLQVLKGPQGTLFGRNAIGGAILAYAKQPTYDFEGYALGSYGTLNTQQLEGAINIPIVADKLALRVAAQTISSDGFVKGYLYSPANVGHIGPGILLNNQPVNLDESDVRSVRGSLRFDPTEGISNLTTVDYSRSSGISGIVFDHVIPGTLPSLSAATLTAIGLGGLLNSNWHCGTSANCDIALALAAAQQNPHVESTDVRPYSVTQSFGVINTTKIVLAPDLSAKNIFGYRTIKQDNTTDLDGTAINILGTSSLVNQKQVTEEFQLSGALLRRKLQFVLGGFYYKTSPDGLGGDQALEVYVLGGLSNQFSENYLVSKSEALYGQFDYDASDFVSGLKFTGGYRYTWDKQSGCAYGANYGPFAVAAGTLPSVIPTFQQCQSGNFTQDPAATSSSASNLTASSQKGTYTFAADWQATDNVLLYATARRGYRAGGYNIPVIDSRISNIQQFAPETLDDIELGAKGQIVIDGRRGSFAVAAFRGKVKGAQTFIPTSGIVSTIPLPPTGFVLNKNDYTLKGVEGQIQIQPLKGLSIGGNAAYISSSLDKVNVPADILAIYTAANSAGILNTFTIYNQPKWQVNGNAEYSIRDVVAGADAFVGADYHYQTSYAQNDITVKGYQLVDARLGLRGLHGGAIDATLWVKNLFNENYYYGGSLASASVGAITYLQAPPRTAGATVTYRF